MGEQALRAARANRVFCADEKRIRTKNTVIDKNKDSVGGLSKIADSVRTWFSSVRYRRSARTGRRPRKLWCRSSKYPPPSAQALVSQPEVSAAVRASAGAAPC
ncbi:MAG: hypothetical protein HY848_16275 [Betaproteobacteria bacterium]|nr:hypothetical protein [Betaproteobacteria bacterium]